MAQWWVGGYGPDMDGTADGIGLLRSRDDGSLEYAGVVAAAVSPAFLVRGPRHLYAAAEGSRRVDSFLLDDLSPAASAPSGGQWPCHLTVVGDTVVVSNYGDGTLGVISEGELFETIPGEGSGPHRAQDGPHAHSSLLLDSETLLSLDLGADRIHVHRVEGRRLIRTDSVAVRPGTGPRDIARHSSGLLYVLGEHGGELLVFEWLDGGLAAVASIPLPGREEGDQAAGIAFDGPFVYLGLRGSQRISVLRTSLDGRLVEPVGWASTAGQWPRHLAAADGILHVANQLSNTVASFRLGEDGMPTLIAEPTPVPSPTYLLPVG